MHTRDHVESVLCPPPASNSARALPRHSSRVKLGVNRTSSVFSLRVSSCSASVHSFAFSCDQETTVLLLLTRRIAPIDERSAIATSAKKQREYQLFSKSPHHLSGSFLALRPSVLPLRLCRKRHSQEILSRPCGIPVKYSG
jgi:hypothetical protein